MDQDTARLLLARLLYQLPRLVNANANTNPNANANTNPNANANTNANANIYL